MSEPKRAEGMVTMPESQFRAFEAELLALRKACECMVEWDAAENAARPYADDNGAAFYERMAMCRRSSALARAALAMTP